MDLEKGHTRRVIARAVEYGCSLEQTAYILATAAWETAHTMKPVREAYWLSEDWRRRNLRYYPWYGRGFVQLTWQDNYIRAGQELNLDLTSNPDVVMDPDISAEILVFGMMEGWFTGKTLPDYVNDNRTGYLGARRVVNGTDRTGEIAALAVDYASALRADGWLTRQPAPALPPQPDPAEQPAGPWAALMAFLAGIFEGVQR